MTDKQEPPKIELKILPSGLNTANKEAYCVYINHLMDVIRIAYANKDIELLKEMSQTLAYARYEVDMMIGDIKYPGSRQALLNPNTEPTNGGTL